MPGTRPRVVIDFRLAGGSGGFARYESLLQRGLRALEAEGGIPYEVVPLETRAAFLSPLEWAEIPLFLRKAGAALYHSPTFSAVPWPLMPCPWITTVHDLIHIDPELPHGSRAQFAYYHGLLRPYARRAARVCTVSAASRARLAPWLGVSESEIELVPNALEPALSTPEEEGPLPFGLESGGYFFCLSNPKPHKNVALLVDAYRVYRATEAAQGREAPKLVVSFAGHAGPGLVAAPGLRDRQARTLARGALALFFPSLAEGYGLPPLESAVTGTPLAVSDIAPHREALALLDPGEVRWVKADDRQGWIRALTDAGQGRLPRPSGVGRAALARAHAPELLAARMDHVYRQCLREREPLP